MSESVRDRWLLGLLVLFTLLPYAGTWGHEFLNYDDDVTIVNLPLIRQLSDLAAFFEPVVRRGLPEYMPLKNLSYAVDYALFGLSPAGFRVQQQGFYLASVLLFFFWLRDLFGELALTERHGPWLAFASAALFALHPAHVESVTWLSGRKDVLSGAFVLAALLSARRDGLRAVGLALVCSVLALLSKPTAVVLPALFVLQDLVSRRPLRDLWPRRAPLYVTSLLLCGGFALFYVSLTAGHAAGGGAEVAARAFEGPAWLRWGQQLAAFLRLATAPLGLAPFYPTSLLDPELASPGALLGLVVLSALAVGGLAAARRRSPWLLPLGLFALPLLPVVVSPPWGQYVAARYLFHALGGVCVGLALGWAFVVARAPRLARPAAAALVLIGIGWGALTVEYNATWRSSSALWEGALRYYPRFTALHDMAARAHELEGRPDRAVAVVGACLEVDPEAPACLAHMGELLLGPRPGEGEAMLRRALPRDPTGRAARALAVHLLRTGRAPEAFALYERALHAQVVSSQSLALLVELGVAAGEGGKTVAYARELVRAAAANHPGSPAPIDTLRRVARASGDAALAARVEAAAAGCGRSDCFKRRMGW